MTIFEIKKEIISIIKNASQSPALDADVFLQSLLEKDKTYILMNRNLNLSDGQTSILNEWALERARGTPVAYITGHKEFYGYDFFVNKDVLIPKPDTEILVARAVEILSDKISANENCIPTVCDMCTGSGCIALSILRSLIDSERISLPHIPQFTLVDISRAALDVAKKNAKKLLDENEIERVKFVRSNLFDVIPYDYDMIVTNPPYIPHTEARNLLLDGRSEPLLALDGDVSETGDFSGSEDGLAVFRRLAFEAKDRLVPGGYFLSETGEYNADAAAAFLTACGYRDVRIDCDLEGQKRLVQGRL